MKPGRAMRLVGMMRKEWLQVIRDPSSIAIAFFLPLLLLLIFGYGVSLDLDVFDPREAPGVGSPEPAGLSQTELMPALAGLAGDPALLALEVMEFNPDRDAGGRTAALLARLIGAVFPRRHGA